MRTARVTLLLAAALLMAAELASLSFLLRRIGDYQTERNATALDQATRLVPRIADWARSRSGTEGETLSAPWIEPFDQLIFGQPELERAALELDEQSQRRFEGGELVVASRLSDPAVSVIGWLKVNEDRRAFRLTETPSDLSRVTTDRTLIAQHALILFAALLGLGLAAFSRGTPEAEGATPALRAYEEAMSRMRLRDDERQAAFGREKVRMTSVLRDRETMARAGELTAGIVHEVRNSMGVIAAQAKFAERSSDDRAQAASAAIADEVRTLQSVMTRFLDFIRTEKIRDIEFDLSHLITRVVTRERAHLGVSIDIEGTGTLIRGDEDLLERAIENVIRNAGQASGKTGKVVVKFGADSTHAFAIVEDDGPGIADIEKALRPFESARPGGLGLGLPLVLKILTLHQGTLDLGPGPGGRGTQVICRWPKVPVDVTTGNTKVSAGGAEDIL